MWLVFGLTLSPLPASAADSGPVLSTNAVTVTANGGPKAETETGHSLFRRNCAHCHGDDAPGDEGPNLHNLAKTDARIATIIKNGIKGEMSSFGRKFKDPDTQALIACLRTLKD